MALQRGRVWPLDNGVYIIYVLLFTLFMFYAAVMFYAFIPTKGVHYRFWPFRSVKAVLKRCYFPCFMRTCGNLLIIYSFTAPGYYLLFTAPVSLFI